LTATAAEAEAEAPPATKVGDTARANADASDSGSVVNSSNANDDEGAAAGASNSANSDDAAPVFTRALTTAEADDIRRAVRTLLHERNIQLWEHPYSADDGASTVPRSLADELAKEVVVRVDLVKGGGTRFGVGEGLVPARPVDVFAALEKLRTSARKKLAMPGSGTQATYEGAPP